MTSLPWSRVAIVAPLLLAACPQDVPGQEETTDKTETSNEPATTDDVPSTSMGCSVGMEGCPCTNGGACDPGLMCNAKLQCEDSPGLLTGTETTVEPMTDSGEQTTQNVDTSTGDTDTGGPECVSAGDGKESEACLNLDPLRPFCENDVCVGCVGLPADACKMATDNDRPICAPDGRCVECNVPDALEQGQCQSDQPHCNLDTMMCEGCLEHDECPDTACQIAKRTCFPKNNIIYVRASGGGLKCTDVPNAGGWEDNPYCDLETATLASKLPNGAYTLYVMGNSEGGDHGSLIITPLENPVSYAIVHESGTIFDKHTRLKGYGPLLVVPDNTTVYLREFGLQINQPVGDSSLGIDCQPGGSVWLEDSRILDAEGPGIRSEGCDIHLNRSAIAKGQSEGIDMNGGSLFAVNSFISQNGFSENTGGGGLRLTGGATVDMVFSTIAGNSNISGSGLGDSVQCDGPASVKIRNSILARKPTGNNPSVNCAPEYLAITNTVHDGTLDGAGNLNNAKVAAENLLLSLVLDNFTGAYRVKDLESQMKWLSVPALWKTGDPYFDHDGTPRAQVDGAPDIAGGDVLAD